ncbi:MAG: hypothetical protein WCL61_03745 [bacterium]
MKKLLSYAALTAIIGIIIASTVNAQVINPSDPNYLLKNSLGGNSSKSSGANASDNARWEAIKQVMITNAEKAKAEEAIKAKNIKPKATSTKPAISNTDYENVYKMFTGNFNTENYVNSFGASGFNAIKNYIVKNHQIATSSLTTYTSSSITTKLTFFKGEFIANRGNVFNQGEKNIIQRMMVHRLTALCNDASTNSLKTAINTYRNKISDATKIKDTAVKNCQAQYNNYKKNTNYDNNTYEWVLEEKSRLDKEDCLTSAYTTYNTAIRSAYNTYLSNQTTNNTTNQYTKCINSDLIKIWNWK